MRAKTALTVLSTALVTVPLATTPLAALADAGQFIITPSVGAQYFDSSRDVGANNTNGLYGLGGEYQFSKHWGAALNYTRAYNNMDVGSTQADVGYDRLSLDGMYHFSDSKVFDPYLKAGVGHDRYDYSAGPTDQNTDVDAGIGARFHVTDRFSITPEIGAIHELDTSQTHGVALVGFSVALGGEEPKAVTPPPPPVAEAPPAPLDSDGDGVIDSRDRCPNTPRGRRVDQNGCPFVLKKTVEMRLNINFQTNKAVITDAYMPEVEKAAKFLAQYDGVKAEIAGYTDATGKHAYNLKLSQHRADAVRDMLINRYGIAPSRLTAVGYAEANPVASNATAAGRAENRRVIAVMKAETVQPQ